MKLRGVLIVASFQEDPQAPWRAEIGEHRHHQADWYFPVGGKVVVAPATRIRMPIASVASFQGRQNSLIGTIAYWEEAGLTFPAPNLAAVARFCASASLTIRSQAALSASHSTDILMEAPLLSSTRRRSIIAG